MRVVGVSGCRLDAAGILTKILSYAGCAGFFELP